MTIFKTDAVEQEDGYLNKIPIFQFILLSLMFPMWGTAASLNDVLITQFKSVFTLSNFASAFVQSAFYLGYFLIAIPASRLIKRTSYKIGVLTGLVLYLVGSLLFYPASQLDTYVLFLGALFVLAMGLSFLETSANTYSSLLGPSETSTLRLNISQTFYPIGSILGVVLGKYLVFGDGESLDKQMAGLTGEAKAAFGHNALAHTLLPYKYMVIVLAVSIIIFALTQYPKRREVAQTQTTRISETLQYLKGKKMFWQGIFAQFMYVGMQTAVWSFIIRLALGLDKNFNERMSSNFLIYAYVAFFIGKFIANLLMRRFRPNAVLLWFSILGVVALIYVMFVPNLSAVYMLILVSGLFGPAWATIYAQNLELVEDKRHTETAGAIIVMSIVGGAFLPLIQGAVADTTSMSISFVVDAVAFAVVGWYAYTRLNSQK